MVNIKSISLMNDGQYKRVGIMYDVLDDSTGKTTSTNNRFTRVITDETIGTYFDGIMDFAKNEVEENSK